MEFGLLLLRVVIGVLFVGHGTQKLFGWFGGPGLEGARGMFASLGYPRPRWMAALAGIAEAGAGVLLVLGLFTPLAAAAIIGVMLNAIVTVHLPNGPWAAEGGYEYNLVLIAAVAALTFAGPGMWAVDNTLGVALTGAGQGLIALVVGLGAGVGALALRRAPQAAAAEQEQPEREQERRAA